MNAYITDNLGQRYKLIQFFNHDEQKYLFALEFVSPNDPESMLAYQQEKSKEQSSLKTPPSINQGERIL